MKQKGFTLIELLAVIVILAIIAFIAIPVITNMVENSKKGAAESSALGYIDAIEKQIMIEKLKNINNIKDGEYDDVVEFNDDNNISVNGKLPTAGELVIEKGKVIEATICISGYTVEYDNEKAIAGDKCSNKINSTQDGIIYKLKKMKLENDTIVDIVTKQKTYKAHVYNYEGNQTFTGENVFGNANDIATSDREAQNMVIVKINGDLTIEEGATVRPYYSAYGGPKGLLIYVTGKLINKGTIDNSHGAKAVGEDVYLWQNKDETYEYVPAVGSLGGVAADATKEYYGEAGKDGENGVDRKTGGGGSGAMGFRTGGATGNSWASGAGGKGTSYSGGSSGATLMTEGDACKLPAADNNGGAGGDARGSNGCTSSAHFYSAYGGVGNPGGIGVKNGSANTSYNGPNGTGGLLIISADEVNNMGTIRANGTSRNSSSVWIYPSAGSGAGSINIFYTKNYSSTGTIVANGGERGLLNNDPNNVSAGNGGDGSITIGSIKTKSFVKNN